MTNKKNLTENLTEKPKMVSAHYAQALLETIRDPFLILDSKLRVVEVNEAFCKSFKVTHDETKDQLVYQLGNGQWNISTLKKLLEDVLPTKKIVKDYEVKHDFPDIGTKVMLLNANQIDSMQLILVSFEDITVERRLEDKAIDYTRDLKKEVAEQTKQLGERIKELEEMNQSMIGREIKMVALKKELDELKSKQ